jgi:hypothetical protein
MLHKNRAGYFESDTERECTSCGILFPKTPPTMAICKSCNAARVKGQSPESKMYTRAKTRANKRGLAFDLEKCDIHIPETCPILGIPLYVFKGGAKGGGKPNSPSLDRIDNNRGYVKDNIQVISHLANCMKSSATVPELIKFAHWVLEEFHEDN